MNNVVNATTPMPRLKLPVCPTCEQVARHIEWLQGSAAHVIHDLNCSSCGVMVLNQSEFDRLQWVQRTQIDWKP